MSSKIPASELNPETRAKLGLELKQYEPKLVALGKVLQCLQDLPNRQALWVLRTAINLIKGHPKKGSRA